LDVQLHAAVVELHAGKNAEIKYSTVQNWYSGDKEGKGGIYNFVTKRGICKGDNSKISWTQVTECSPKSTECSLKLTDCSLKLTESFVKLNLSSLKLN
jgi:Fe-S cluster assembly scaffold protein SufB